MDAVRLMIQFTRRSKQGLWMSTCRLRVSVISGTGLPRHVDSGLVGYIALILWVSVVILTVPVAVTGAFENEVEVEKGASAQGGSTQEGPAQEVVEIDFANADIVQFIKFVGEVTGKRFVVDPGVNGNITVFFPEKVPVKEVYSIFQSVLDVYGFTTVQAGSMVKIVPASSATGKGVELKEQAPVP